MCIEYMTGFMSEVFHKNALVLSSVLTEQYAGTGESVDIQDLYYRYTLESIGEIGFGVEMGLLRTFPERSPFAGSHREMAAVASYRKSVKELRLKSQGDRPQLSSGGEEGDDPPQRARDRRKKPAPKKPADAGAAAV